MTRNQGAYAIQRLVSVTAVFAFLVVVVIMLFSGCDVRRRAEKNACRSGAAEPCFAVGAF